MSVAENIGFERNLGRSAAACRTTAQCAPTASESWSGSASTLDLDARLRTLPIAQRQIVAIARALVDEARLVFMDEPTASLSHAETEALARHRPAAFGRRHCGRVRQPPARRSARRLQPRDGAARRPARRDLSDRGHDPDAAHRTDDRQDLRLCRQPTRPLRRAGRARDRRPVAPGRIRGRVAHDPRRRDPRHHRPAWRGAHRTRAERSSA